MGIYLNPSFGNVDIQSLRQNLQWELDKIEKRLIAPFGELKGPYSTDCQATVGQHVILEPSANMVVTLQNLTATTLGQIVISYNNDEAYTVTITPATSTQTIDGATSKTLAAREQVILIATNDQTWIDIGT
jgi:hypothetical protein